MTTEKYSAQTLRDYLLGQLPETEVERLDELSIVDDELVERLRSVEHDLFDAFARGELHGVVLEQFRSRYLTTPRGQEAVRFAEALQSLEQQAALPARDAWRWRERLVLAAAVVLFALASIWLALENRTLRARATRAELSRDELQREGDRRAVAVTPPTVATLVLAPQLRSGGQLPTVALTDGSQELPVRINLEPVDYPSYEASLIASSGDQPLWRADQLNSRTIDGRKTIELRLPATLLSPQTYLIRISGVPARGAAEIVGEYRFTVVR